MCENPKRMCVANYSGWLQWVVPGDVRDGNSTESGYDIWGQSNNGRKSLLLVLLRSQRRLPPWSPSCSRSSVLSLNLLTEPGRQFGEYLTLSRSPFGLGTTELSRHTSSYYGLSYIFLSFSNVQSEILAIESRIFSTSSICWIAEFPLAVSAQCARLRTRLKLPPCWLSQDHPIRYYRSFTV